MTSPRFDEDLFLPREREQTPPNQLIPEYDSDTAVPAPPRIDPKYNHPITIEAKKHLDEYVSKIDALRLDGTITKRDLYRFERHEMDYYWYGGARRLNTFQVFQRENRQNVPEHYRHLGSKSDTDPDQGGFGNVWLANRYKELDEKEHERLKATARATIKGGHEVTFTPRQLAPPPEEDKEAWPRYAEQLRTQAALENKAARVIIDKIGILFRNLEDAGCEGLFMVVSRNATDDPERGADHIREFGGTSLGDRFLDQMAAHGRGIDFFNGEVKRSQPSGSWALIHPMHNGNTGQLPLGRKAVPTENAQVNNVGAGKESQAVGILSTESTLSDPSNQLLDSVGAIKDGDRTLLVTEKKDKRCKNTGEAKKSATKVFLQALAQHGFRQPIDKSRVSPALDRKLQSAGVQIVWDEGIDLGVESQKAFIRRLVDNNSSKKWGVGNQLKWYNKVREGLETGTIRVEEKRDAESILDVEH